MGTIRFYLNYWKNINPKEGSRIKRMTFMMVFLGVLAGTINTGLIGLINEILNAENKPGQFLIWAFVALMVILPLAKFFSESTINWLFVPISTDLMRNFMRGFMSLPIWKVEKHGVGKFYAILNEDLRTIYNALRSLVFIVMQGTIIVSCLVYLGWLSLPVLGWTLLFLVGGLSMHSRILSIAMRYLAIGREEYGKEINYFEAISKSIKDFKLHRERRNAFFDKLVEPSFDKMTHNIIKGHNIFNVAMSLTSILYFALMGTLLFGGLLYFDIPREILTGYALTVMFILAPLESVVNNANTVVRAEVSVKKMEEVGFDLFTHKREGDFFGSEATMPPYENITLKNVTHHYGEPGTEPGAHDFVLGPLDLTLKPGEVTIIAGGNGSGKTTLAKIIAGLYEPASGELLFNGKPITSENRDTYRQNFSAIFVDFYLFPMLLGFDHVENLDEKAQKYLEDLDIGDKLTVKDGVLSTTDLSQGQRKRLALMISYLEDRPLYIFDEWTANQDPMFRDFFYREVLVNLKKMGKTVLVITHDDKYFHSGDRIIKLDMGKIDFDVPSAMIEGKNPLEITNMTLAAQSTQNA